MNKFIPHVVLTLFICCLSTTQFAQKGKINFVDPNENFYDTQRRINKHFKKYQREIEHEKREKTEGKIKIGGEEEQELAGYELYKRWEYYMAPRVYPSGDKSLASRAGEEYQNYLSQNALQRSGNNSTQSSTWQPLGPFGDPTGGNAGRINAVRFDPAVPTGIWVCTPDGGLWSTANSGTNWTTNTDQLSMIGNADVCFDPTNSQNMYLATGDGDATDAYSIGILKSTNGGSTWATTGLTWAVSQGRRIYKLLINPLNKNVIFAATTAGLYRTTNAGTSWAVVSAGGYTDIEYKPGDTTTVYAVTSSMFGTTSFYKSTNGGSSFSATSTGLPTGSIRYAIAVTPANPAYVYVVSALASNYGFQGFYQSTNSGGAFTAKVTSSPNLLGWASNGLDVSAGGQGWYTLSVAANPTNANEVIVGGVNTWKTTNGGTNWTLNTHWTGSGAPYVHADCHDIMYKSGTSVYIGCDGGIFYTSNSGSTWFSINGTMNIAEIYKMGNSKTTYSLAIAGHQDNGTNVYTGGWAQTMGGDGMSAFIDWNNDAVRYGEQYQGSFNRTTNSGTSWSAITTGITGTGAWNTPWHQDPNVANTLYAGIVQMFKSTNQGTNWTQIGSLTGTSTITEFAVAPSNSLVIYVIQGNILWKTTNGGTSWTNITGTLPVASAAMTFVTVENDDPNSVWITFSGYSSANKVFQSTNGGTSWTNYSTGLPNLPVNCITYWNGTKDGMYVGCDVGIYYRDSTQASWVAYNTGLPNVSVHDLAIFYPTGKIRAATYGRGMWEADLFNNGTQLPVANFTADKTVVCAGMTVNFTDLTSFAPTSWSWTFESGTPATSTAQNPSVVYNIPGTYSVSLTATNVNGNNTMTKTLYITVSPVNTLPLVEGFQGATFPPTNWQNYDAAGDAKIWAKSSTVGKASTASMYYDNYNIDAGGTRDEMRAPKYNFGGFSTVKLYFDVAYAQYDPTYSDTLAIMVSSDCGLTYTQMYAKGGTTLATAPSYTAATFVPTAAQWRTDTVYLNSYAGMGNVMVSFQNRGHYGQALYVDNINITGSGAGSAPVASFTHSAVMCTGQSISFTDQSTNTPTSWSWAFSGGTPATSTSQNPVATFNTTGTHTVTLIATNSFGSSSPSTQTITVTATPTVAIAGGSTICSGNSVVLTGGVATTYTWSANAGSATTSTVSVTPATTTVYTLTGANGSCTSTATSTVTVNATPTVTVNSFTICSGSTSTLTASGATSYSWSTSATTNTISVTPATTTVYTVTGTTSGCSSAKTSTVTVNATPTVTVNSATVCAGSPATLTASGATTYSWSTSATTNTISATPAVTTVYTVTGTSTGCSNAKTATITVNANPTVTVNSATVCSGSPVTLTASGAASYSWSTSATTNTISVNPATTTVYTVTGTTAGCSSINTSTVTVSTTPTVAVNSATVCAGSPAVLTANGATTYSWSTSATTNTISASPVTTTVYTVTGTSGGCSMSNTATVTVNASPTVTVNSSTVCAGSSSVLTASGATTYSWSTSATTNTISVTPATTTVYTVTGTSAGCSSVKTSTVTVTPNPTVTVNTATICVGSTATLTASGATTYSWNTGAVTASISPSPTVTTIYTVTGTTGGCIGTKTTSVSVSPNPTVTSNSPTICAGNSTTLTAGGASTYSWSPPTGLSATSGASVTANPTSTTVYTVTGTMGSCSGTSTSIVTVNATPTVNVNSSTICSGNSTTLNASGATTYTWSPGTGLSATSGASVTANPASTTVYTITGATGTCNGATTSTVTVVANLTVTVNNPTICAGSTATLTASGASTYIWNTGGSTSSINVTPGSTTVYSVTGTSGSCNASNTATVTVVNLPTVSASTSSVTICSGQSADLSSSGATTYIWDSNAGSANTSTVTVSPISSTTYTVTGTTSGCSNTATVSVAVNATPTLSVNSAGICTGNSTTLTAAGGISYSWTPSTGLSATTGASVNANPSVTTIYTVTSTSSGCTGANSSTVTVTSTPTVTVSSGTVCAGTSANLNAGGATSYTWNPGGQTGSSILVTPAMTTTYTVIGDNGGCTASDSGVVTVNNLPSVSVTAVQDSICSGNSTGISATGALSYSWTPGTGLSATTGSSVTANPTVTTIYDVTGTDANGCSSTTSHTIIVNGCMGINTSIIKDIELGIYPNPGSGTFMLTVPSGSTGVYTIEIRDALSQIVYLDKVQVNTVTTQKAITIPDVNKGVYTFVISNGVSKLVRKIIVE